MAAPPQLLVRELSTVGGFLSRFCSVFGVRQLAVAAGRRSRSAAPGHRPWTLSRVLVPVRPRLPALVVPPWASPCAPAAGLSVAVLLLPPC